MRDRFAATMQWSAALLALPLLYAPLAAVAALSFNDTKYGGPWKGFTTRWYAQLAGDAQVLTLALNTLAVAASSTAVATVLGTAIALGLDRSPWPRRPRRAIELLLHLPVVTPDVIIAGALLVAFGVIRSLSGLLEPGFATLVIAHVTFQVPFVALVVLARSRIIGRDQEEAARDLYATTWGVYRRVLLPQLWPAIVAGAVLAFILSLDDFIVTFFCSGPSFRTLPLHIYPEVRRSNAPLMNALSTVVVAATFVLAAVLGLLLRPRRR